MSNNVYFSNNFIIYIINCSKNTHYWTLRENYLSKMTFKTISELRARNSESLGLVSVSRLEFWSRIVSISRLRSRDWPRLDFKFLLEFLLCVFWFFVCLVKVSPGKLIWLKEQSFFYSLTIIPLPHLTHILIQNTVSVTPCYCVNLIFRHIGGFRAIRGVTLMC